MRIRRFVGLQFRSTVSRMEELVSRWESLLKDPGLALALEYSLPSEPPLERPLALGWELRSEHTVEPQFARPPIHLLSRRRISFRRATRRPFRCLRQRFVKAPCARSCYIVTEQEARLQRPAAPPSRCRSYKRSRQRCRSWRSRYQVPRYEQFVRRSLKMTRARMRMLLRLPRSHSRWNNWLDIVASYRCLRRCFQLQRRTKSLRSRHRR